MTCSVEGCERPLKARSMCDPHYRRLLKYGQPTTPVRSAEDRLLPRIDFDDPLGCWLWTGTVAKKTGYGVLKVGGRAAPVVLVHRLVYSLFVDEIPDGMQIDHLCLNRLCVNPDHLEVITPARHGHRSGLQRWRGQSFWPGGEG